MVQGYRVEPSKEALACVEPCEGAVYPKEDFLNRFLGRFAISSEHPEGEGVEEGGV